MNGKVKQLLAACMAGVLLLGEVPMRTVANEMPVITVAGQVELTEGAETSVENEADIFEAEEVSEQEKTEVTEIIETAEEPEETVETSEEPEGTETIETSEEPEGTETVKTVEEPEGTEAVEAAKEPEVSEVVETSEEIEVSETTESSEEKEQTAVGGETETSKQDDTEKAETTEETSTGNTEMPEETEQEASTENTEITEQQNEVEPELRLDDEAIEGMRGASVDEVLDSGVEAASVVKSGTCGENATWVLDEEGTLTISGTGEMYDYSYGDAPWYSDSFEKVVIEKGITSIGNFAFANCCFLDGIEIPEGVTKIGDYAFELCYLDSISLPESLERIGNEAFVFTDITEVTIPAKTTNIGWGAFAACSELTSINVSSENTAYKSVDGVLFSKNMFVLCQYPKGKGEDEYVVPVGTQYIDMYAFFATWLENVELPKTLEGIGSTAFGYSDIKRINIPVGVRYVSTDAFAGCESFSGFSVASDNKYFCAADGVLFSKDMSEICIYPKGKTETEYVIPTRVETICDEAFRGSKLKKIVIPKTVKNIKPYAFWKCENLNEINIPKSVTSIGRRAFASCSSLTSITIPSSVTEISEDVFSGCSNLTVSCVKDSAMHKYAIENSIPYVLVEEEPDEYQITFDTKGGSSIAPQSVADGGKVTKPANPTRKGYQFVGWYKESKCKNKYNFNTAVSSDLTLYAKWKANKYSISFNGNGSTSGSMKQMTSCSYGTSYTLTANAYKKSGYSFAGWNTKKDGTGTSYKNKASIKNLTSKNGGTVKLYAQWKKPEYKITYKLDGGTNSSKNPSSYYQTTETIKLYNPTKKGYEFKGWYSDAKFKKKVTSIPKGSKGNKTFYAKWKKIEYTITYHLDGGKNNKNNIKSYTVTTTNFKLKNPSKKGYKFIGWYSDSKFKKKVTTIKKGSTGNKKFYAKWEKEKYTITYELNGGKETAKSKNNPKKYSVTTITTQLEAPSRTGYTFTGWYTDKKCSKKNKISKITKGSTGNLKLYAGWEAHKFTIVYNGNGNTGGSMKKQSMVYDSKTKLNANKYTRKGYTFKGWSTSKNGNVNYKNKADGSKITSKNGEKITLYAKWEKVKYKISYHNLYDGKNHTSNPTYYYITDDTIKLQNPKRSGYTFVGWYTDSFFKNKIKEIKKGSTGDKNVYARWKEISYQIVFDGNGATGGSMNALSNCQYDKEITLPAVGFSNGNKKFSGWNTKPDGSGTAYADGAVVKNLAAKEGAKVTLYAQWKGFLPRKSAPALDEQYYCKPYNSIENYGGTGNCVWYAYGRAYEILGTKPNFAGNAKDWWNYREQYSGYSTDVTKPREGAIVVWGANQYSEYGHVAIVEEILEDGRIVYSESSYGSVWYYNHVQQYCGMYNWYGNSVQYWGTTAMTPAQIQNLNFIGYIYLQ